MPTPIMYNKTTTKTIKALKTTRGDKLNLRQCLVFIYQKNFFDIFVLLFVNFLNLPNIEVAVCSLHTTLNFCG